MLRRRHKKSRGGCFQCKARHVKCDERRPVCSLCELSDRGHECQYAIPQAQLSPGVPSVSVALSPDSHSGTFTHPSPAASAGASPNSNSNFAEHSMSNGSQAEHQGLSPGPEDAINLDHMEMLVHLTMNKDLFYQAWPDGGSNGPGVGPMALILKKALEHPYLLHELLALSACHLAFLHPQQSASWGHQAVKLQTRAISLFNSTWTNTKVDKDNCVPMLLFSSVLGNHLIADALGMRDNKGLPSFITNYAQRLDLHRGVRVVAHEAWPMLMQSELAPMLAKSIEFTSRSPRGDHCNRASEMVESSTGLVEGEKEACRAAIRFLQVGFDETEVDQGSSYNQMIFLWGLLSPPEFSELLKTGRFEALVILSYYALLLHHGKEMWQIGDAGSHILDLLTNYLGPASHDWMIYPMRMMGKGVSVTTPQAHGA